MADRPYYDHEVCYQQIVAKGGSGWDSFCGDGSNDSYVAFEEFLNSPFATFLSPGKMALDMGCGGGQVAMMIANRGCTTHGVDFSPTAVLLAQANAAKAGLPIDFREGDCLVLTDYADGCMDFVADNHLWHCIVGQRDRRAFLRSAFRVLKRGGVMFSETMTREGSFDPLVVHADPRTFISTDNNRYWPSREEALSELKSAGFEILHERLRPQPDAPGVGDLLVAYLRRAL